MKNKIIDQNVTKNKAPNPIFSKKDNLCGFRNKAIKKESATPKYNIEPGLKRTMNNPPELKFQGIIRKEKRLSFIDTIYKKQKETPGVGNYPNFEHGFKRITMSPKTIKTMRH